MPFLNDDEFLLLMDIALVDPTDPLQVGKLPVNRYKHISEEDLTRLRSVGIKTTLPFQCVWSEIETSKGNYDWSYLDNYVNKAEKVGMKTILFTPTHGFPSWFPDEYFAWGRGNTVHREVLSYWNQNARNEHINFILQLTKRYASENCLIAFVPLSAGETVYLNEEAFYDPNAILSYNQFIHNSSSAIIPEANTPNTEEWLKATYIETMVEFQTILAENNKIREIFLMLHPAISTFLGLYGNGNKWIEEILTALKNRIPDVKLNHIYYTWVQWEQYWSKMNNWKTKFDQNVFGGAEYAEGLPENTPKAIANNLRGLIIAPCYPNIHDHVEDWMLENISNSIKLFKEHSIIS